jgi:hypothetical protein
MRAAAAAEIRAHVEEQATGWRGELDHLTLVRVRSGGPAALPGFSVIVRVDHVRTM